MKQSRNKNIYTTSEFISVCNQVEFVNLTFVRTLGFVLTFLMIFSYLLSFYDMTILRLSSIKENVLWAIFIYIVTAMLFKLLYIKHVKRKVYDYAINDVNLSIDKRKNFIRNTNIEFRYYGISLLGGTCDMVWQKKEGFKKSPADKFLLEQHLPTDYIIEHICHRYDFIRQLFIEDTLATLRKMEMNYGILLSQEFNNGYNCSTRVVGCPFSTRFYFNGFRVLIDDEYALLIQGDKIMHYHEKYENTGDVMRLIKTHQDAQNDKDGE